MAFEPGLQHIIALLLLVRNSCGGFARAFHTLGLVKYAAAVANKTLGYWTVELRAIGDAVGSLRIWDSSTAEVIGCDGTVSVCGQADNFELNVTMPIVTLKLLEAVEFTAKAANALTENPVMGAAVIRVRRGGGDCP